MRRRNIIGESPVFSVILDSVERVVNVYTSKNVNKHFNALQSIKATWICQGKTTYLKVSSIVFISRVFNFKIKLHFLHMNQNYGPNFGDPFTNFLPKWRHFYHEAYFFIKHIHNWWAFFWKSKLPCTSTHVYIAIWHYWLCFLLCH